MAPVSRIAETVGVTLGFFSFGSGCFSFIGWKGALQGFERLGEGQLEPSSEESDHVSSLSAAEAVEGLGGRKDDEGWVFLVVEGAGASKGGARHLKLHVSPDHVFDSHGAFRPCNSVLQLGFDRGRSSNRDLLRRKREFRSLLK